MSAAMRSQLGKAQVSANRGGGEGRGGDQGRLLNGLRTNFTGGETRAGLLFPFPAGFLRPRIR